MPSISSCEVLPYRFSSLFGAEALYSSLRGLFFGFERKRAGVVHTTEFNSCPNAQQKSPPTCSGADCPTKGAGAQVQRVEGGPNEIGGFRGPSGRTIVAAVEIPGNRPSASSLDWALPARWTGARRRFFGAF